MTKIKILSLFVIFVLSLFFVSTMKTYAGVARPTAIIVCDGNLEVIKADILLPNGECDTGSGDACEPKVGNSCAECFGECRDVGFSEVTHMTGAGGKIILLLTGQAG